MPYVYYAEEAQIAQPRSDLPTALGAYMMQNQHSLGQILRGLEMLASSQEDAAVAASVDILLSLGRKERAMAIYREHPMIYRQAMSQLPSGDSINLLKQGQYVLSEGGYWTELVELVDMASKAEELYRIRNPYLQSIVSTSAKQYYKEMAAIMNDGAQPGGDFVSLARRSGQAHEPMLAVLVLHLKSDDLHRATNEYAVERAKFVKTYWNEPEMQELLIYVDAAVAQRNGDGETARRRLITVNCARPIRIDWVRREVCAYISAANSARMNEVDAAGTPETSPQ